MAKKWDDTRSDHQIKAYPRGNAQGGRAIQSVKGSMSENDGTSGHRTVIRETSEGRAIARTRDQMPMVEVEKQGDVIGVDHGIIDLLSVAPLNPDSYKDGVLWRTPYVHAYIAASEANPSDPNNPIVDELEDIPDNIKGVAPADGTTAKSLRANEKRTNQDNLYAKKIVMSQCPASVFTGRTRLWVQAMYGRHDELGLLQLVLNYGATPGVQFSTIDLGSFFISTSTGVFYESTTGNHYCIDVHYDYVDIYPMEAMTDSVEDLRSWLLDPSLTDSEKEKVETYILSDSVPVYSKRQRLEIPATFSFSMGYGWHFNWIGDRCDIVLNDIVDYSGGGQHNVSTHYRLLFSRGDNGKWVASRSIIEGPTYWKSLRNVEPIASPSWGDGTLEKFGAHIGPQPYGDAPIYVFYAKNTLKVCRYSSVTTSHTKTGITKQPSYFKAATVYSIGSDEVNYHIRSDWSGNVTTFSCGTDSVSYEQGSHTDSIITRSSPVRTGVLTNFGPSQTYNTGTFTFPSGQPQTINTSLYSADLYFGPYQAYSGVAGEGNISDWDQVSVTYNNQREGYGQAQASCSYESVTRQVNNYTQFLAAIPFYDSEAFYMYGQRQSENRDNGSSYTILDNFYNFYGVYETANYVYYGVAAGGGTDFETRDNVSIIDRLSSSTVSSCKLVCSAGTFDASLQGKSGFWSTDDKVSQQYQTFTSASCNSVKGPQTGVDSGNSAGTTSALYVGWA